MTSSGPFQPKQLYESRILSSALSLHSELACFLITTYFSMLKLCHMTELFFSMYELEDNDFIILYLVYLTSFPNLKLPL